jgi:AraC-like DNA-binding protein
VAIDVGQDPALIDHGGYAPTVLSGGRTPALIHGHRLRDDRSQSTAYPTWRLLSIVRGHIGIRLDGQVLTAHGPAVFLLRPGVDHGLAIGERTVGCHCSFLVRAAPAAAVYGWSEALRRNWQEEPGPVETWGVDLPTRLPPDLVATTVPKVHRLADQWWRGRIGRLRANAILADILCDIIEVQPAAAAGPQPGSPGRGAEDPGVAAMLAYIRRRLRLGVTPADLVRLHGTRRTVFYAWCRAATGWSPAALIDRQRRELALELLNAGTTAQETATACGFSEYSTFCRRFRDWFGTTPRRFRSGQGG